MEIWGPNDAQKSGDDPRQMFWGSNITHVRPAEFFLCNLMFLQFDIGFFARIAGWLRDKLNYPVEQRQKSPAS
jgi:hypothetical protein